MCDNNTPQLPGRIAELLGHGLVIDTVLPAHTEPFCVAAGLWTAIRTPILDPSSMLISILARSRRD